MKKIKSWKDIPYTDKANEVISNLKEGIVLAVRVKNANSSQDGLEKAQIEFAEKINTRGEVNALQAFNSKDSRFSSGAQRVWLTADLFDVERFFGKDIVKQLEDNASVEILKPMTPSNGSQFRIKVEECLESQLTATENEYKDNYLKRAGQEGNFFYAENGERVCTRRSLVVVSENSEPAHVYIKGSFREDNVNNESVMTGSKQLSEDMQGA